MNIAEPLKQMMENKGISRSKLGREIGVHTSTVSNWLDGKDVKFKSLLLRKKRNPVVSMATGFFLCFAMV